MLEPGQFKANEAWVVFQLNDSPICTEQDGDFNCVALMDAASGFILGTAFVSASNAEPSAFEARRLFKAGWAHTKQYPITLFTPKGQFQTTLPAEAARHASPSFSCTSPSCRLSPTMRGRASVSTSRVAGA